MKRLAALLIIIAASAVGASAQCTGSGAAFSCAAGSTPAQIQSAINSASNGATITFANGSYTWGGGTIIDFNNTRGATLICASVGGCNVASTGVVIGMAQFAPGTNTNRSEAAN